MREPLRDSSVLAGYSPCACAEPCGAWLCCGRGLEGSAWLTGLQRASDSRMGSKASQTIIPVLRAEPSCSATVINGLSHPALTGGDGRLTQIGRERGAPGLQFWGKRQGQQPALLPAPAHVPCPPAATPAPPLKPCPRARGGLAVTYSPPPLSPRAAKRVRGLQRLCHHVAAGWRGYLPPRVCPQGWLQPE